MSFLPLRFNGLTSQNLWNHQLFQHLESHKMSMRFWNVESDIVWGHNLVWNFSIVFNFFGSRSNVDDGFVPDVPLLFVLQLFSEIIIPFALQSAAKSSHNEATSC